MSTSLYIGADREQFDHLGFALWSLPGVLWMDGMRNDHYSSLFRLLILNRRLSVFPLSECLCFWFLPKLATAIGSAVQILLKFQLQDIRFREHFCFKDKPSIHASTCLKFFNVQIKQEDHQGAGFLNLVNPPALGIVFADLPWDELTTGQQKHSKGDSSQEL